MQTNTLPGWHKASVERPPPGERVQVLLRFGEDRSLTLISAHHGSWDFTGLFRSCFRYTIWWRPLKKQPQQHRDLGGGMLAV